MTLDEDEDLQRYDEAAREDARTLDSRALANPVSVLRPRAALEVAPSDSVAVVIERMRSERNGCALVVENGRLVGIFTERDILLRGVTNASVADVMTPDPETLLLEDNIATALHKMVAGKYRNVPIVDENGAPVGVLSQAEAVRYLVGFFPAEVLNNPPRSVEEHPPRNQHGG